MCGIIGITGHNNAARQVLEGLKRLEYRGYDSAGIATVYNHEIQRRRAEGKLAQLEAQLSKNPLPGNTAIGHTRWATHGAPTEENAHPHATAEVAVVHNGIIENFRELREKLQKKGHHFFSHTDTEVVPVLITEYLRQGLQPDAAVSMALKALKGTFALGIVFTQHPEMLIAARHGSPLVIGIGEDAMFMGSDAIALVPYTQTLCYLEDGDWAILTPDSYEIRDSADKPVTRSVQRTALSGTSVEKGNYRHFMQKEIFEQPGAIAQTLGIFTSHTDGSIHLPSIPFDLKSVERIRIIGCGTSYYAAMVAKYWLEEYARTAVETDIASEFRYRQPVFGKNELAVFISQSGETADTLAALRLCKQQKIHTLAVINAPESSMEREASVTLHTYAGPEIGVASTKAFTTQLVTLASFTLALAAAKKSIPQEQLQTLIRALEEIPSRVADILHHDAAIAEIAASILSARDVLYIGRGTSYAIAMEGALKLKEISYLHAEGYAAGELKHGPIALIDEHVPVIVLAPTDNWFEKTSSNTQEAVARGAKVILFSDEKGVAELGDLAAHAVILPKVMDFITPILYAIPVQLLAYHVAVMKGTDVDQPRNLAKSVTVE